jgi:cytosine/adenosine deaminase-related metal-dependent hydrolase
MSDDTAKEIRDLLQSHQLDLLVVHIAEGKRTDPESNTELGLLESKGLLTERTAIVHGIALSNSDFAKIAAAKAALIWSPRSNIELYGETMDLSSARSNGVTIAIAPDWSPTGSSNMLAELRYAARFNKMQLNGVLTSKDLFEMATIIPARVAKIDDKVGRLETNLLADLFLLKGDPSAPYDTLLNASPQDISLVLINGVPLYGEAEKLRRVGVSTTEEISVCGITRLLNTSKLTVGMWADIKTRLSAAMAALNVSLGPLAECDTH